MALFDKQRASYLVEADRAGGPLASSPVRVPADLSPAIGFLKSPVPGENDLFGVRVALSADGSTLAVAATQTDTPPIFSHGTVYVFTRGPAGWEEEATLTASNQGSDFLGDDLGISADGTLLVVGASEEESADQGLGQDGLDDDAQRAGAAYAFRRDGLGRWREEAYLKAAKPGKNHRFGAEVATDADGSVVLVTATLDDRGRVHVFDRQGDRFVSGPSILGPRPEDVQFGSHLSMAAGGRLAVAGANGAVHVLVLDEVSGWEVFDTLVPPVDLGSPSARDFGRGVALSADGTVLAVGDQRDNSGLPTSGAVYVY